MSSISYTKSYAIADWTQIPTLDSEESKYSLVISKSEHLLTNNVVALTLIFTGGEYHYSNGVLGDIRFSYTILDGDITLVTNKPFDGKTIITEGSTNIEPDVSYPLSYTGDEIDQALGRLLGTFYGDESAPGCHLVGRESYNPVNLNEITVPGMYTAYYYNHGPADLNDYNGTSPIRVHVYVDEDYKNTGKTSMWQTIISLAYADADESTGQEAGEQLFLFYRDLKDGPIDDETADYGWAKMKLSTGSTVIVNNLRTPNPNVALSAQMGYYLKYLIDNDEIGSVNMLSNTGFTKDITGWILPEDAQIHPITESVFDFYGKNRNFVLIPASSNSDGQTRGIAINQDKRSLPNINGSERDITLSFYVKTAPGTTVFAKLSLVDSAKNEINVKTMILENEFESDAETGEYMKTISSFVETTATVSSADAIARITLTLERPDIFYSSFDAREVAIYFGVIGNTESNTSIYLPQLEVGRHATSWHMHWLDMWDEFDNARYLNEIPIDEKITSKTIKDQQTIVFSEAEAQFIAKYIATGGGGGFVAQKTPPTETELLWYCTETNVYNGVNYIGSNFYAYMNNTWSQLSYKVVQSVDAPADRTSLWVNTNTNESLSGCRPYSETEPPDLCYYDNKYKKWRVVGAAPRPSFIIQASEPAEKDRDLMWIHPDTWIARVYYNNNWYPIQAVWGARNL